jgi:hypothetical protein
MVRENLLASLEQTSHQRSDPQRSRGVVAITWLPRSRRGRVRARCIRCPVRGDSDIGAILRFLGASMSAPVAHVASAAPRRHATHQAPAEVIRRIS